MKAIKDKIAVVTVTIIAAVLVVQAGLLIRPQCGCAEHSNLVGVAACYQMCPQS
jgi:hypothetical protein